MKRLALLAIALLCSSCASARFAPTGEVREPLSSDCSIAVVDEIPDDRGFDELGTCMVSGPRGTKLSLSDMTKLKQCACRAGGNAIVLPGAGEDQRRVAVVWILSGKIDDRE